MFDILPCRSRPTHSKRFASRLYVCMNNVEPIRVPKMHQYTILYARIHIHTDTSRPQIFRPMYKPSGPVGRGRLCPDMRTIPSTHTRNIQPCYPSISPVIARCFGYIAICIYMHVYVVGIYRLLIYIYIYYALCRVTIQTAPLSAVSFMCT